MRKSVLFSLCLLFAAFYSANSYPCTLWLYKQEPPYNLDPDSAVRITFDTAPNGEGVVYKGPFADDVRSIPFVRHYMADDPQCDYCRIEALNLKGGRTYIERLSGWPQDVPDTQSLPDGECFREFRIRCFANKPSYLPVYID